MCELLVSLVFLLLLKINYFMFNCFVTCSEYKNLSY